MLLQGETEHSFSVLKWGRAFRLGLRGGCRSGINERTLVDWALYDKSWGVKGNKKEKFKAL